MKAPDTVSAQDLSAQDRGAAGVDEAPHLAGLNPAQRAAACHGAEGGGPLLVIAGAGSGKTDTLAHRVAHLVLGGADPRRILLLTFTRRAALEMTRRARRICARDSGTSPRDELIWSGTFHSIANRLLRHHAEGVGLDPSFTVLDRSDSADLLDLQRSELGLAKRAARFPRKATCLSIYSHAVNAQCALEQTLEQAFPWCSAWKEELRTLFSAYVESKQRHNVLDYDDLLLYWYHLMSEPALAAVVRERFDHVLVDEYQDTNALQAAVLLGLQPEGRGLTVVGDDAQSIFSFRAATVRNILDFPNHFEPPAAVVTLEQNYRSSQPILEACNAVIAQSRERFTKDLFSIRSSAQKPRLVTVEDEACQVDYVAEQILAHREEGIALKQQAVLMRAAHHSDPLEVELSRRNIPFVKFGGLKFLEAAHVKDLLCLLRWVENPRDVIAAFRILQLLPGIGPAHARRVMQGFESGGCDFRRLGSLGVPPAAALEWPSLCGLLARLRDGTTSWPGQIGLARRWYEPHLERLYDAARVRAGDLEQLEQISAGYPSRERFLTELCLDPPNVTGDEAGPPHLDEDYLVLSTIHSAKGQEWDAVFVLNAADGCIPSDMATDKPEQIEEERRLLYVAMTRARDHLHVIHPLRFFKRQQHRYGDDHVFTPRSRFITDAMLDCFERRSHGRAHPSEPAGSGPPAARVDVGARLREMWR
ncbi:MAG: ATP-dependent helicase [Deltaproteobacteria bacterium]|nr:ATP-dependent helicase [Deltaproteobacteria bacterium]MBW2416930.1 ATP-dependent helicase [Deltaproteobacteria bacterium]